MSPPRSLPALAVGHQVSAGNRGCPSAILGAPLLRSSPEALRSAQSCLRVEVAGKKTLSIVLCPALQGIGVYRGCEVARPGASMESTDQRRYRHLRLVPYTSSQRVKSESYIEACRTRCGSLNEQLGHYTRLVAPSERSAPVYSLLVFVKASRVVCPLCSSHVARK